MLKPAGLIRGHYECLSFKETVPILTKLLAFDVEAEAKGEKVLKHPNTAWRLVMHEGGPDAPIKPVRNHYGVRVTTNEEVDRATEYLERSKDELRIKIIKPRTNHNAYSVHFYEPGATIGKSSPMNMRWKPGWGKRPTRIGRRRCLWKDSRTGVMCPRLLHMAHWKTTIWKASERFYREVLGLEVVKLWP